MKPAIVTQTIYQGQTWDDEFIFEDPTGTPQDFTDMDARMQIRLCLGSPTVVLELSTTNGLILPLDDTGVVRFNVPALTTSALSTRHEYESWWYDLEVFDADGKVQRLMQGAVVFWPETTR